MLLWVAVLAGDMLPWHALCCLCFSSINFVADYLVCSGVDHDHEKKTNCFQCCQ